MSLSKRTHIMLDPAMFSWLEKKAETQQQTIGSLIRGYLESEFIADEEEVKRNRERWWKKIKKLQKQHRFKGKIDYKELINAGRRF